MERFNTLESETKGALYVIAVDLRISSWSGVSINGLPIDIAFESK